MLYLPVAEQSNCPSTVTAWNYESSENGDSQVQVRRIGRKQRLQRDFQGLRNLLDCFETRIRYVAAGDPAEMDVMNPGFPGHGDLHSSSIEHPAEISPKVLGAGGDYCLHGGSLAG